MDYELQTSRAWAEINLCDLEHNIKEVEKVLPNKTKIMAVIKDNAYGHGMVEIAKKLEELKVNDFAVATLDEGIILRKNGINGNILIMGYVSPKCIKYALDYDLTITIVDKEYAEILLNDFSSDGVKAYIKINTGMNRLGIRDDDIEAIKKIYQNKRIRVLGMFSHFPVSDSDKEDDIAFCKLQIAKFDKLINKLKEDKIDVGKVHIQASYGMINYEYLEYDYVRLGIFWCGVNGDNHSYQKIKLDLRPVLSLKARVSSVKKIEKGETVSYGRSYMASKKEKIASVTIGYGDGYPRSLSFKGAKVFVNGCYAEVIGKICMDQLMINVTGINVKQGDIVTLIGEESEVRAEVVAMKAGTITNELLCKLSNRLNYIYIDK